MVDRNYGVLDVCHGLVRRILLRLCLDFEYRRSANCRIWLGCVNSNA